MKDYRCSDIIFNCSGVLISFLTCYMKRERCSIKRNDLEFLHVIKKELPDVVWFTTQLQLTTEWGKENKRSRKLCSNKHFLQTSKCPSILVYDLVPKLWSCKMSKSSTMTKNLPRWRRSSAWLSVWSAMSRWTGSGTVPPRTLASAMTSTIPAPPITTEGREYKHEITNQLIGQCG